MMSSFYQTGGNLPLTSPAYIKRQADSELYQKLIEGYFCYVLTSRQMGKSSLRVRVMDELKKGNVQCSFIDLTGIGSQDITLDDWYYGIMYQLTEDLSLQNVFDLDELWGRCENLSPLQRLSMFLNTILSNYISVPIVIFVDEIDSIIKLKFDTDDFFAWIRYCFNSRADNTNYNRLTFCLLGVATPTDLIKDRNSTPFNIGKSIELLRFQEDQLQPLISGLQDQVADPEKVGHEIYKWTGGQPFLTHRLCQLISSELEEIQLDKEEELISWLVENRIIKNWEFQDEQSHLKTIRDRLLKDEDKAVNLLSFYQQILASVDSRKPIKIDGNLSEVMALRLTGLVVAEEGYLFVYNEIYRRVFSVEWVAQELERLRPYAVSLTQWLASDQDSKYLLTGQGFLDAHKWSLTRQLTNEDLQYLAASQELRTKEIVSNAKRRAKLFLAIGVSGFIGFTIASGVAWINLDKVIWNNRIEKASTEALANFPESSLDRTISLIATGRMLQQKFKNSINDEYLFTKPSNDLFIALTKSKWLEANRFFIQFGKINEVGVSNNGKIIVAGIDDGTVKVWKQDGSLVATLLGHQSSVNGVAVSADSKTIVSGSGDKTVKIWNSNGSLINTLIGHQSAVNGVAVSADGKIIVSGSVDKTVKIWNSNGSLINTLVGHQAAVTGIGISADGKIIVSGSVDKTVKIWRLNGSLMNTLIGHQGKVNGIGVNVNGKIIVSSSMDKTVKVWQQNGSLISSNGYESGVYGIGISADGETIVSGGGDKTVKVGQSDGFSTLVGHQDTVYGIGVSADGETIVSGGDRTVKIWKIVKVQNKDGTLTWPISKKYNQTPVSNKLEHFILDDLLAYGCEWIHDYLDTHPQINRKELCPK